MKCPFCSADVPKGAVSCPGCGITQVPGEGLEYHTEREQAFRAEREAMLPVGSRPGRSRLPVAGRFMRLLGFIIDSIVLGLPAGLLAAGAAAFAGREVSSDDISGLLGMVVVQMFVLSLVWALFEGGPWHATPGKKLLGMQVVDVLGEGASYGEALMRNFARFFFQGLGCIATIDAIWIFTNPEHQTLHDRIAGTRVVDS